jgi:hypothetical protein
VRIECQTVQPGLKAVLRGSCQGIDAKVFSPGKVASFKGISLQQNDYGMRYFGDGFELEILESNSRLVADLLDRRVSEDVACVTR